jgi:hypothetical protein
MSEYNHELATDRHQQVLSALAEIKKTVAGTNERLDVLNGRTRLVELKTAVLEERSPSRQGGVWGAVGGAVSGFLAGWMKP